MIQSYIATSVLAMRNSSGVDYLARLRRSRSICRLVFRYHFGYRERLEGEEAVRFDALPGYADVLTQIQDKMMQKIMFKGIAIECNPSSNQLIGTFERYDQHPIFRFNSYGLSRTSDGGPSNQIRVSVNTDDQGIFDTSLENEYALLFGALSAQRDSEGRPLHGHDEILAYLDHLRIMGNDMVFQEAEKGFRYRSSG